MMRSSTAQESTLESDSLYLSASASERRSIYALVTHLWLLGIVCDDTYEWWMGL